MGLYDAKHKVSNDQDVSGTDETIESTDDLDLTAIDRGAGSPIYCVVQATSAATGGTSVRFAIQDSTDASTWEDIVASEVYEIAQLTAFEASNKGIYWVVALPSKHNRYVQVTYTLVDTFSALDVTTYFTVL